MISARSMAQRALGSVAPRIVRPRSRQVLFASIPDFADNAFAMYRHLITSRDGLDLVWLVRDEIAARRVEDHFGRVNTGPRNSISVHRWDRAISYLAYLRSALTFHTHGVFNFSALTDDRTVVSLWHGMPLKSIGALDSSTLWRGDVHGDVHVASSQFFRSVIAEAFEVSPRSVVVSGLPRSDVLKGFAPVDHDPEAVRSAVEVPSGHRLLLWLPTHRVDGGAADRSTFLEDVAPVLLEALLEECEKHRCRLVVKLHPYDRLNDSPAGWLEAHPAVRLLTADAWERGGIQLYDLVAASDGLLTDVSSVLVDYLHMRRPIGVIGLDEETYGRDLVVSQADLVGSAAVTSIGSGLEVEAFVRSVADGAVVEVPSGDVAEVLNEDDRVFSSELIAQHVGL